MNDSLYGRRCRVYIAKHSNNAWEVSNLRCVFQIEKSILPTANHIEVSIYNLSSQTEASMIKEGYRVIVEAGYDGVSSNSGKQYGKIFDGEIVQVLWDRENNIDTKLTLIAMDGDELLNRGFINKTVEAGLTQKQLLEFIISQRRLPSDATTTKKTTELARVSPSLSEQRLPRGKVFFGRPKDYINDIAIGNSANFYVDDGQVSVVKMTDKIEGEVLVLTPQTGLVGTPQQVQDGVSFRCLLNPAIKLDSLVKLDKSLIRQQKIEKEQLIMPLDQDGTYRVCKFIHIGDTRGDEWYTNVIGVSLSVGGIPIMLDSAMRNPN